MTTEMTAAAEELVINERNGHVLPLDVEAWTRTAVEMLTDGEKWERISAEARRTVQAFDFDRAAAGILAAFRYLEGGRDPA
jgi:glycosyltransferase involved in cell wall biosynthesis